MHLSSPPRRPLMRRPSTPRYPPQALSRARPCLTPPPPILQDTVPCFLSHRSYFSICSIYSHSLPWDTFQSSICSGSHRTVAYCFPHPFPLSRRLSPLATGHSDPTLVPACLILAGSLLSHSFAYSFTSRSLSSVFVYASSKSLLVKSNSLCKPLIFRDEFYSSKLLSGISLIGYGFPQPSLSPNRPHTETALIQASSPQWPPLDITAT